MTPIRLTASALAELLETVTWYESKQEGIGLRFNDDVESLLAGLSNRHLRPLKGFERYGAKCVELGKPWPYRLIVIEGEATTFVVAFEHHRRNPGYWLSRLQEIDRG